MGHWVKRPRGHKHEFPKFVAFEDDRDIEIGDEYVCSCGLTAEVKYIAPAWSYPSGTSIGERENARKGVGITWYHQGQEDSTGMYAPGTK